MSELHYENTGIVHVVCKCPKCVAEQQKQEPWQDAVKFVPNKGSEPAHFAAVDAPPQDAQDGMVMVRADVVAFLKGEAKFNGCWIHEKPTAESGAYWWRKYLPDAAMSKEPK